MTIPEQAKLTRAEIVSFCETAFRNMPEGTDFLALINALDDGLGFEAAMNKIGFHRLILGVDRRNGALVETLRAWVAFLRSDRCNDMTIAQLALANEGCISDDIEAAANALSPAIVADKSEVR